MKWIHVDYLKRTELLAKESKSKGQFACLCRVTAHMACLVIEALKCLILKWRKGRLGVGGVAYTFNQVLPHESHREMQPCNLVTEQWSERFMAGY